MYAQAIRKKTKPPQETHPQETHPQEGTEQAPPQETTHLTCPEQDDADEPYLIRTRENLWTTTEDLHQTRLLKSSSAVLHSPVIVTLMLSTLLMLLKKLASVLDMLKLCNAVLNQMSSMSLFTLHVFVNIFYLSAASLLMVFLHFSMILNHPSPSSLLKALLPNSLMPP